MKLKKMLSITIMAIIILSLIFAIVPNKVSAATTLYLGLTANKDGEIGYAISDPNHGGAKLWKILEYTGTESSAGLKANGYKDIYCLKEGFGFSPTTKKVEYDLPINMKLADSKSTIKSTVSVLESLVDGTISKDGKDISRYNALLALGDLIYLADDSAESRTAYLNAAGIHEGEAWTKMITDNDIEAVQQAAVWYFTNYGDETKDYDKTDDSHWLNYTTDGTNYDSLANYYQVENGVNNREGLQRQEQAEILYNYLINQAIKNADIYQDPTKLGVPAILETTTLNYEEVGSNYIVGPIKITEQNGSIIPYTIDLEVKVNGTLTETGYTILKEDKTTEIQKSDLKELAGDGSDFYISVPKNDVTSVSVYPKINYTSTTLTLWTSTSGPNVEQPVMIPERQPVTGGQELVVTPNQAPFDLALRKYITKIDDTVLANDPNTTRVPSILEGTIASEQTATYKHRKDPVVVKIGTVVTYEITIYNEGSKAGRATKIVDQLPTGLEFVEVTKGNFELDSYDKTGDNTLRLKRKASNEENLEAYTTGNLDSETIEITCKVVGIPNQSNSKILTNVAWISEEYDAVSGITITNQENADRDSEPSTAPSAGKDNMDNYKGNSSNKVDLTDKDYFYKGEQDDDDFEKLILLPESFDLKLIKNITEKNGQSVPERLLNVDVSKLNTLDSDGNLITTAEYEMNKEPVGVKKGDIVTYRLRVYNESSIDGYASEITEEIPEGLEFIWSEKEGTELENDTELTAEEKEAIAFNQKYLWGSFVYNDSKDKIVQVSTRYLDIYEGQPAPEDGETDTRVKSTKNLIKAFDSTKGYINTEAEKNPDYREVYIKMKVISENVSGTIIKNEACVTDDSDENGDPIDDRDSKPEDWKEHPNHEDDEDHDYVVLQSFDLALRKFIIAVSKDETIEDEEYLKNANGSYTRAPVVDTSKLNTVGEEEKLITTAIYNHTKEPVLVQKGDTVIYMLRVYNEGEIDGYASEIKDHLPDTLEFVDGEFNDQYGWVASEDGRTLTTTYLKDSKIAKVEKNEDGTYVLTYKEVPVMCKVKDTAPTSTNLVNLADITVYEDENKEPVTDRDSIKDNVKIPEEGKWPEYNDDKTGEYIPGQEDDDDFDRVIIKEFDLALRKWVTQAIVTDSKGTTVTNTGHKPYDDPEQVVKVELHRKKINEVTVKFRYSIRIINEGEIAGYAKEITDYVPEGLKFVAEDNSGWTDEGNNVISTRLLENKLLQPGEYADVEVVLTWINNKDNMGVKTNIAEISEDYNEYDVPDKDSTPDNQKPGEDDIDDAPVMLSVSTGGAKTYFLLGFTILVTLAGGLVLIKKYVL